MARSRMPVTAVAAAALLLFAVTSCGSQSETPNVPTIAPPTAPSSPPLTQTPDGAVIPAAAGTDLLAVAGIGLAALNADRVSVAVYSAGNRPSLTRTVAVESITPVNAITPGDDGQVLAAGKNGVVSVDLRSGAQSVIKVDGNVLTATQLPDGRVLAGTDNGRVIVLTSAGSVAKTISGFVRVDEILAHDGQVAVVDKAQSSITDVDLDKGSKGAALRIGQGATTAIIDPFGRVIAIDTVGGQMAGYTIDPLINRFLSPVTGGPFAVDYDDARRVAWVTVPGVNEIRSYTLGSGLPEERSRAWAIGQADSVAVDDSTGMVFALSATGGGLQVLPGGR